MQPLWIQFERLSSLSIRCISRSRSRLVSSAILKIAINRRPFFRGRLNTLPEGQRLFFPKVKLSERGTKCRVKIRTREETYTTWSRSICTAAHGDGSDRYRKRKSKVQNITCGGSFKNGEFALEEENSVTRKPAWAEEIETIEQGKTRFRI